jgi:threonyl-tRNA synthetase
MKLTLSDGSVKEFENGLNGKQIAGLISKSLEKECIGVVLNDEIMDYRDPISCDGSFKILTKKDPESLNILNHSCAHVLATAVKHLYKDAEFAFGPAVDEGFYYDIHFSSPISDKDFAAIEKEMRKIVEANYPFVKKDISISEAEEIFKDQELKLIHAKELTGPLSVYEDGDFVDLCKGPHVPSTSYCKGFKLTSLAGAYFKGDKNNIQLTRIYGTCFFNQADLENHLKLIEERKQSDHRKIGKDLDLFMLSDYGPGFPFWLPNGMIFRNQLEDFWKQIHYKNHYLIVKTPIMLSKELWETSGHWDHYKENMYITKIEEKEFAIKPMNCPGAILVYKNHQHSYKELPIRVGELGNVHRYEASGALNGLFRVRAFTQDDAHTFIRPDQIESEITHLLNLYHEIYSSFGLSYHIELSTRPEKDFIGTIETWDKAETILKGCLEKSNIPYKINPGDGAFYGPKLDFKLQDSLKRIWQCGTIQLDMQLPGRFDCVYIDENGEKKTPLMIHRAIFGSVERFTGILIEHFKGNFPTWLAPVQVKLLPVRNDLHLDYCKKLASIFEENNIRYEIDDSEEKLGKKIQLAASKKVPYSLVIGDKEVENNTITYRIFGSKDQHTVSIDEFVKLITEDIKSKKLSRL